MVRRRGPLRPQGGLNPQKTESPNNERRSAAADSLVPAVRQVLPLNTEHADARTVARAHLPVPENPGTACVAPLHSPHHAVACARNPSFGDAPAEPLRPPFPKQAPASPSFTAASGSGRCRSCSRGRRGSNRGGRSLRGRGGRPSSSRRLRERRPRRVCRRGRTPVRPRSR